jgi:hypothetical protein
MNFQQIILTIAIIILIIVLVIIGLTLSKTSQTEMWPPVIGACPDYWVDLSGNGSECLNSHNLGTCNLPSDKNTNAMNFNQAPFNGSTGNCSKYKWSNECKVTWDGITSGVKNPCDVSS